MVDGKKAWSTALLVIGFSVDTLSYAIVGGGHGRGWYISAAVNAAIPGKQGAVSLGGWMFCKLTGGPNGGIADSLDEPKAAFRAAWRVSALGESGGDMLGLSLSARDPTRSNHSDDAAQAHND
jgi:hypothetical protein